MGINMVKMRAIQDELDAEGNQYLIDELKSELLNFVHSDFFRNTFIKERSRIDVKQSSRVLNNWEKEGLIRMQEAGKWKTYNRIDSFWLEIVTQLREFGVSIEKIKIVKEHLFKSRVKRFIPIEYAIMYSVIKAPMVLLVHLDGNISLMPKDIYASKILKSHLSPYIYFDMESFIRREFPNNSFDLINTDNEALSDEEIHLIYCIRSGDYQNIKVTIREGEVMLIEAERKVDLSARLLDIIKRKAYQNIQIVTQAGTPVYITATEKFKTKKK